MVLSFHYNWPHGSDAWTYICLLLPHLTYVAVAIPVLKYGRRHPEQLSRHRLYCSLDMAFVSPLVGILTGTLLLATFILQACTTYVLWRNYRSTLANGFINTPIAIRASIFSTYVLMAFALNCFSTADPTAVAPAITLSTVPLAVFFIFGTQKDVLDEWRRLVRGCRWSRTRLRSPSDCQNQGNGSSFLDASSCLQQPLSTLP
ncbi:uncharacterized protein EI90DRAFT_183386 [Cantharellus anzutake]|uniref:uncharacterized protein n=1 Tax=Cantharellus anzutake TaxID=1750568 RepID=UPI00190630F4|nr:uncharacterized protein EI90DRAFT_183386 [Cantharellus anzutake]KAF8336506.1 hypothetical protein EI90DRAFT_183386 [Cantharellus anzutake]